jgi:PAS domain S-box-containing protein
VEGGATVAPVEREATYRELFDANPQAMWVCHRETGRFLAVNEAALQLYGYSREEFLGKTLRQLSPCDQGGNSHPGVDLDTAARHLKKDGSCLELQLLAKPVEFRSEPAFLVSVRQRTGNQSEREALLERRVAELTRQAEAAQRELETFSYSVSHDLRAPLRHIDGFSRALVDDYGEVLDKQAREYLVRISQSAAKMSQLIDAILQLSRVARVELDWQRVNLSTTAQVIYLELKRTAPERQVEFRLAEGVSTDGDPRLVRQLMEILLKNAWKFTSKSDNPCIEFGHREINREEVYFVRDNGAGFDAAYADKLFSLFHRLHRADEFEGSGVGLAVAHRIIGRHGGRIWAESAPNHGATFYFTLKPHSQG